MTKELCEFSDGRKFCREKASFVFRDKWYCEEHYEIFHCFEVGKPYIPRSRSVFGEGSVVINEGAGI